jgi:hypothetical protein
MKLKVLSLAIIAAAAFSVQADAHHSFAMFDATKNVTLSGTVKEFEWTNPHSWLRVNVADEKTGKTVLWALELSSPARLTTMGMHADSVKAPATKSPSRSTRCGMVRAAGNSSRLSYPAVSRLSAPNARDEND